MTKNMLTTWISVGANCPLRQETKHLFVQRRWCRVSVKTRSDKQKHTQHLHAFLGHSLWLALWTPVAKMLTTTSKKIHDRDHVFQNVQPSLHSQIILVPTKCGQNHERKYNNTLTHAQWIVQDKYPFPGTLFLAKALYTALLPTISQYLLNTECTGLTYLITHKNVDN